jgi:iron complex outermembrane receptor protein
LGVPGRDELLHLRVGGVQERGHLRRRPALGYAGNAGAWEVALFGRNITDEENVKGGIDFNNLTGFDNEPRIIGVSFRASYR